MRKGWLAVAIVLGYFATWGFINGVYWIASGWLGQAGSPTTAIFVFSTFAWALIFYYLTYVAAKHARSKVITKQS